MTGRLGALSLLVLLLGACTATPITLPVNQDMYYSPTRDAGLAYDGGSFDLTPPPTGKRDGDWNHLDGAAAPDAAAVFDAAADTAGDSATDGVCLECPLIDGPDHGTLSDAEAGPTADAVTDIDLVDQTVRE